MKRRSSWCALAVWAMVLLAGPSCTRADVKLAKIFGSHMVLQQDQPLPVWGWAEPGEEVTIRLNDATATVKTDARGNRPALWALAKDYGRKGLVYSGPLYKSMKVEGRKVRLSFAHAAGGLKSRDGKPLSDLEIAGPDGKFVPAEATIDGEAVVVSARGVSDPRQVWFGWHNMCTPNLVNQAALPASPFQTNHWQGGTGE